MIRVSDLHFSYQKDLLILKGLNIVWQKAQIHGIIGANGSGKSTFFNILKGLLKPNKGIILRDNHSLKKEDIAYLPSDPVFYPRMKGREYLDFFRLREPSFDIEKWNNIMELPLDSLVENYSTGMKKKLAIMGCIGLDRPILLFDEPFNGLDSDAFQILQEVILAQKEKSKTVVLSSHISHSLSDICDDIAYLENGKITRVFEQKDFGEMNKTLFAGKREEIRKKML